MKALSQHFENTMTQLLGADVAPHVVVAVSGGSDSMALALLAKDWAKIHNIPLSAAIVDHGLRAESVEEAEQVKLWLISHAIHAQVIHIDMQNVQSAIQEQARAKRYDALFAYCHDVGAKHLLLAHHRGDQAETLLLRLLRQSRFDGLAGMSAKTECDGVSLLRPLLQCDKQSLKEYLGAENQMWVEDPSNQNSRYARVVMRELIAGMDEAEEKLAMIAAGFGRFRQHQSRLYEEAFTRYVTIHESGILQIDAALFERCPSDIRNALLWHMMQRLSSGGNKVRLQQVEALLGRLDASRLHTLGDCMLQQGAEGWLLFLENGRLPAEQPLCSGRNRYMHFEWESVGDVTGYSVGALREVERVALKEQIAYGNIITSRSILAFPAIRHLEALVALPHIGWYADSWPFPPLKLRFTRAKQLGKWPFFAMTNNIKH